MGALELRRQAGRAAQDADWAVFVAREVGAGGVYGVATTGIHCRAGCPARRPLRANLRLFETPGAAEAAGYRACKRCGGGV